MEYKRIADRTRWVTLAIASVVIACLAWGISGALAASQSPSPAASASGKLTLRLAWDRYPDTFNPFTMYDASAYEIVALNYDLLVGFDPKTLGHPQGLDKATGLAYEWTQAPDQLSWTFKLRQNVKWQDGQPFTAKDVVFTYEYCLKNQMGLYIDYLNFVKDVVAVDDNTVRFDLTQPKANILGMWVPILPEHIWSKIPPATAEGNYSPKPPLIGTGAFQTVAWHDQDFVKMKANLNYWRGRPTVDELLWITYQNTSSMTEDLIAGKLQYAYDIPEADFPRVANTPGLKAWAPVTIGFDELCMNCYNSPDSQGNPVLRDVKFRQALNWAVDKNAITTVAYGGFGEPADTIINKGFYHDPDWHWTPPAAETYGFDLNKAKALLDAAGYKDTNGDGIREDHQGKPIKLRLWGRSSSQTSDRSGRKIAGWFKQIGLQIDYSLMTNNQITKYVNLTTNSQGRYAPDYDMFLWGWGGDVDPNFILSVFLTKAIGVNNWSDSCFSNKEYDQDFIKQQGQTDPLQRKATIDRMQQILYEESPYIVLAYPKDSSGYETTWGPWIEAPEGKGPVAYNTYPDSYLALHPLSGATGTAKSNTTVLIIVVIVVAALVVLGVIVWLIVRRGQRREEVG
jgi:peptide/nickel transport system substrate-binding protein